MAIASILIVFFACHPDTIARFPVNPRRLHLMYATDTFGKKSEKFTV